MKRTMQAALAGGLLFFAWTQSAMAGCTQGAEAAALHKSLRQSMRCDHRTLRAGQVPDCVISPPPACAGTLAGDVGNLAYGLQTLAQVDTRLLSDQLKCQRRIGRAMSRYVVIKLRALINGHTPADADSRARRHLDAVSEVCALNAVQDTASQLVLPLVGPQCAGAVAGADMPVAAEGLENCLRQLLDVWTDRWGPNPQPLRPNIVFILTDDQRWDTTDATHSPDGVTPIMPGLRSELGGSGVELTEAFMTTPLCCPSRASILRGQYAHATGVYTNSGPKGGADDFVPLESETLSTLLQGAGYRTGFYGKYLNGYNTLWTDSMHIPPGWSVWSAFKQPRYTLYSLIENGMEVAYGAAEADYSTDVLREKAKQFITDSVALGQPFFLYLAVKAPHGPWEPAPRHIGKYAGLAPWRPASYNEPDVSDKPTWVQSSPQMDATEQAELDDIRIAQLEMLQSVDEAIGGSATYGITGIMQHLRDLGVADDTLVLYFADNGWHWGEHRFQAKNKPYDESIRSPMFVRYPKLAPLPRVETRFALNVDICPTFLELALRPIDPQPTIAFSGDSLVRVLDGTAANWRSDFLHEGWPAAHVWASVRDTQWKYIENAVTPGDPATMFELELYDLQNDPLELDNRATDPTQITRIVAMAARLRELRPTWPADSDPTVEDMDE